MRRRFEMPAACALGIFSGMPIYNFGVQKRLRAFLYPIFMGRSVEENGICRTFSITQKSRRTVRCSGFWFS